MSEKLDWAGHKAPKASEIDWGGQAFPTEGGDNSGLYPDPGMSLRDWFAGQLAQAAVSGHISHYGHENHWFAADIASHAYELADAMIAARKAGAA